MSPPLTTILDKYESQIQDVLYVVNPDSGFLSDLHRIFSDMNEEASQVRILSDQVRMKDIMGDFLIASRIGGLVESDDCEIRTIESYDRNPIIASEAGISFWTHSTDGQVAIFDSISSEIEGVIESLDNDWESAAQFSWRTPGLPRLRRTMKKELGQEFREDFDSILSSFDELRGTGGDFNEVSIALLAAARNELLLYDVAHWGEDVGLASRATFTRKKHVLENIDVIETSKQTVDIGRPRQRLHLVDDDPDISAIVAAVSELE